MRVYFFLEINILEFNFRAEFPFEFSVEGHVVQKI